MQRTNLAIKREIVKQCRINNIPYSLNAQTGSVRLHTIAIQVKNDWVHCHFILLNDSRITVIIEYIEFNHFYLKFRDFYSRSCTVFIADPKTGLYELQKKKRISYRTNG